uniref:Uncharacterized protein n=1 Tax=Avena sativa TaxID=4498 RepID=A0ACD5YP99_AVESA
MSGLDLNALPDDLDILDAETNAPEPLFCTQAVCEEIVEESPDNDIAEKVADGADSGAQSARGNELNFMPPQAPAGNPDIPSNTAPTATSIDPNLADDGVPLNEEVASSPQEPFLGMRFDTIGDARSHYNSYAKKLGFSIKSNTSQRQAFTNELRKQTFVCNRYRPQKTEEEKQERMNVVEEVSPIQIDDDDEKEHNHPMVVKPSLSKYLRSHKGIPPDEREFLKCLHDCNLETGRMMTVMSSFYGAEAFVPYAPKDITNLRTNFRSENKEWDMSDTVAYFAEIKDKDPGFYSNFSFDEENRVETIF